MYTPNRKKSGIGREYRGRKPKGFDPRVQAIVDERVKAVSEVLAEVSVAKIKQGRKMKDTLGQLIVDPDHTFSMDALYEGRSKKYTPADKIAAATAWMVTGNAARAEGYCGVPANTISQWRKTEWWANLTAQVRKEKSDEADALMTGVIHSALEAINDRIENGDVVINKSGAQERVPVKAKDLASITGIVFDKRALGRGDPTSRTEKVSTSDRLKQLKEQFEKFSNAKEITGELVDEGRNEEGS